MAMTTTQPTAATAIPHIHNTTHACLLSPMPRLQRTQTSPTHHTQTHHPHTLNTDLNPMPFLPM